MVGRLLLYKIENNKMKLLVNILLFFVIFNFPIPYIYNSIILATIISLPFYLFGKGSNRNTKLLIFLFKSGKVKKLLILFVLICFLTIFWILLHNGSDWSLLKANVLALISVGVTIYMLPLVVNYCFNKYNSLIEITNLFITLFVIQSMIQILAFVFPWMAEFTAFFQKKEISEREFYGIRALALTGNPFFTLSSSYGFVFILYFYNLVMNKIRFPILTFVLLLIGSFFAGRTAFVGLVFGLIYYIFVFGKFNLFLKNIFKLIFYLSVAILLMTLSYKVLPKNIINVVDNTLLPWVFEFLYTYQETGTLATTSSDHLNEMYFKIPDYTMFYGDAKYTNSDGSYYMHTDGGYMRTILFYGIFGVSVYVIMQFLIIKELFKFSNSNAKKLLIITLVIYLLVLNYKGEVLMHSTMIQPMFCLMAISYLIKSKNDK